MVNLTRKEFLLISVDAKVKSADIEYIAPSYKNYN